jgi:excisionase family DNA binding protein
MDINQPLTLTVEQTAKLLGIGRSTAYELVRTGDIPSLRLGRRIVVPIGKLADQIGTRVEDIGVREQRVSAEVRDPGGAISRCSPEKQGSPDSCVLHQRRLQGALFEVEN